MNKDRLASTLSAHDIDLLIGTSPENIRYATGYLPFQGAWNRFPKAVVAAPGVARPIIVLPVAEVGFFLDSPGPASADAIFFGVSNLRIDQSTPDLDAMEAKIASLTAEAAPNYLSALRLACDRLVPGSRRVAVDRTGTPDLLDLLAANPAGGESLVSHGEDLWRFIRMVKTADEVALLEAAAALNQKAIAALLAQLGKVPENELEQIYRDTVSHGGGSFQHYVGHSGRMGGSYRGTKTTVSAHGSRFRFDLGMELDGYCSDLGGTAQVGAEPSDEERRIYDAITAGVDAGVAAARPGVTASALHATVIDAIRKAGIADYKFSLAGHGIGVEPRDYPIIAAPMKSASPFLGPVFDPEIEAGMVLNIECPINAIGVGGYQHEVTLAVGENGNRLLSSRRDYTVSR